MLLDLIKSFEGFSGKAYPDPGTGDEPWTIGYGTTVYPSGNKVREGDTCEKDEAEIWLKSQVGTFRAAVQGLVKVPCNDTMLDALTSLAYNIGTGAFSRSTLLRLLNEGNYVEAAAEFNRWNLAAGKVLPGLTARRKTERELFEAGIRQAYPQLGTIVPTLGTPMPLPFIAAALPSILAAVPDLIKIFGDRSKESSKQYQKAAEKVVELAVQATNSTNAQEAAEKIDTQPAAAEAVREAVRQNWFELVESGGGGIQGAREANLKASEVSFWKQPAFVVSVLLLPLVYYVAAMVLQFGDFSQETKAMVVAAIITGVLGGITGFFLGSSVSSRAKDEVLLARK